MLTRVRSVTCQRGMTLLEMFVTLAMLSVILLAAMQFLNVGSTTIVNQSHDTMMEEKVQQTVNEITTTIREAGVGFVTISRRTTDSNVYEDTLGTVGSTQDVICLPTARDNSIDRKFRILDGSGSGAPMPRVPNWQGLVMYCCYNGSLYRFVDWNSRSYSDATPFRVSSESGATITLTDGTSTVSFNRGGVGSGQTREVLLPDGALLQVTNQTISSWIQPLTAFNVRIRCVDYSRDIVRKTAGRVPVREVVNFTVQTRN